MPTLFQDLRYAVRQLWKSPGFTLACVLTLAIGIGANTAIFSSMDAVVLHPLAVPDLEHVVTLAEQQDGVRLAMGARREDVLGMILRRAAWLTGSGVCVGLVLAFALARGVANLLRGVRPDDPAVFASITAIIVLIALLASWLPARRAAHIDPMAALRDE